MASSFKINRRELDRFTKAINTELQKSAQRNVKPIRTQVAPPRGGWAPPTITNNFHGNVSGTQIAIGNSGPVNQNISTPVDTELLATASAAVLQALGLFDEPLQDPIRSTAVAVLEEIQSEQPDQSRLRQLGRRLVSWLHDASAGAAGSAIATILGTAVTGAIGGNPGEDWTSVGGF